VASVVLHVVLALVLTGVLACQAGALLTVLRSRRVLSAQRPARTTDLVWVTIPVAVVLFLAARSWIMAFGPGAPAMAVVAPAEVAGRPVSPPISAAERVMLSTFADIDRSSTVRIGYLP
jgi:hypothetical protein